MNEEIVDVETIKSRLHEAVENIDDVDFLKALAETISMKYIPSDTVVLTERQKKLWISRTKITSRGGF
ncbi:MAG: hypothetical protein AAB344_04405 [Bacteroidota bacterium]